MRSAPGVNVPPAPPPSEMPYPPGMPPAPPPRRAPDEEEDEEAPRLPVPGIVIPGERQDPDGPGTPSVH